MSTHNTISDEIIIAYIEGNLDEVKSSEIEKILREDDKEFMRMVDFYHSYAEMEETEFEVTPDTLLEQVKQKIGISEKKTSQLLPQFKNLILNIVSIISQPRPALVLVASSILVLLIITTLYRGSGEEKTAKEGENTEIQRILDDLRRPTMAPTVKKESITAEIINDTLFVKQPIAIKRQILIESLDGIQLYENDLNKMNNEFILPSNVYNYDKVKIIIYDGDTLVYKKIIRIEK